MMSRGTENPDKMKEYFESAAHRPAVIDMAVYSKLKHGIENMLDEKTKALKRQQKNELIENGRGVKVLTDIVKTLGKQQIALSGEDDDSDGNFCQIVNLVARCNPHFRNWLRERKMKGNTVNYLCSVLQNQFIEVLGNKSSA